MAYSDYNVRSERVFAPANQTSTTLLQEPKKRAYEIEDEEVKSARNSSKETPSRCSDAVHKEVMASLLSRRQRPVTASSSERKPVVYSEFRKRPLINPAFVSQISQSLSLPNSVSTSSKESSLSTAVCHQLGDITKERLRDTPHSGVNDRTLVLTEIFCKVFVRDKESFETLLPYIQYLEKNKSRLIELLDSRSFTHLFESNLSKFYSEDRVTAIEAGKELYNFYQSYKHSKRKFKHQLLLINRINKTKDFLASKDESAKIRMFPTKVHFAATTQIVPFAYQLKDVCKRGHISFFPGYKIEVISTVSSKDWMDFFNQPFTTSRKSTELTAAWIYYNATDIISSEVEAITGIIEDNLRNVLNRSINRIINNTLNTSDFVRGFSRDAIDVIRHVRDYENSLFHQGYIAGIQAFRKKYNVEK